MGDGWVTEPKDTEGMIDRRGARFVSVCLLALLSVGCSFSSSERVRLQDKREVNKRLIELTEASTPGFAGPPVESQSLVVERHEGLVGLEPHSVRNSSDPNLVAPEAWDLELEDVIQIALVNSSVLRDFGAQIVQSPGLTQTVYGPSIQETDPRFGVEAALSAFDSRLSNELLIEKNDRVLNNIFFGNGTNRFRQDLARNQMALTKQSVTGALYTLRQNIEGDLNNSPSNLIQGRAWSWNLEGEIRQPLLQGAGVDFNRIAGPSGNIGIYNGVVIALLNSKVSVSQFEIGLRDYLSDVENAYWDLRHAYDDLDSKVASRDRSLAIYSAVSARAASGSVGAEQDKLLQAEEQYLRAEEAVQNALGGRLLIGTRNYNGSGGGTFQGTGGVYSSERRLRSIVGLPVNDGRLIRTTSDPPMAPIARDWGEVASRALASRTELKRQRTILEARKLELVASRNFTKPRLDVIGRYRYRGLGEQLFDPNVFDPSDLTLGNTNRHEIAAGLSVAYPVGTRQARVGVRNAQLRMAREMELLKELERQIVTATSNAIAEEHRAWELLRLAMNRARVASENYLILQSNAMTATRNFDVSGMIDSERRLAEAELNLRRAQIDYALAVKNVQFETGTLLESLRIVVSPEHSESGIAALKVPDNPETDQ